MALKSLGTSFENAEAASQSTDYHANAIELLQDDGDLSDNEMLDAFSIFDQNEKVAKTYCTIKRKSLRTSYIQKRISDASTGTTA